jgi:UDP-glucose 4-epimerase
MKQLPVEIRGKKILVTGGAGFVGSHIVDRLAPENEVVVLDNLFTGSRANLAGSRERVRFIEGDVRDQKLVKDIVNDGTDLVLHLAAHANVIRSIADPTLDMDINIRGTLNVLEACRGSGIERLVNVSTAAVYGQAKKLPITEEHPLNPESPYAVSKLAAEKYCLVYHKVFGVPAVAVRCFNIYGPRKNTGAYANAIAIFLGKVKNGEPITIYGDGEQTRDLLFISDAVAGILLAATCPAAVGDVFNIATGTGTSVNRLVDIINKTTGKRAQVIHEAAKAGEIKHSYASIEKVMQALGYRPATTLEKGIQATWQELGNR